MPTVGLRNVCIAQYVTSPVTWTRCQNEGDAIFGEGRKRQIALEDVSYVFRLHCRLCVLTEAVPYTSMLAINFQVRLNKQL